MNDSWKDLNQEINNINIDGETWEDTKSNSKYDNDQPDNLKKSKLRSFDELTKEKNDAFKIICEPQPPGGIPSKEINKSDPNVKKVNEEIQKWITDSLNDNNISSLDSIHLHFHEGEEKYYLYKKNFIQINDTTKENHGYRKVQIRALFKTMVDIVKFNYSLHPCEDGYRKYPWESYDNIMKRELETYEANQKGNIFIRLNQGFKLRTYDLNEHIHLTFDSAKIIDNKQLQTFVRKKGTQDMVIYFEPYDMKGKGKSNFISSGQKLRLYTFIQNRKCYIEVLTKEINKDFECPFALTFDKIDSYFTVMLKASDMVPTKKRIGFDTVMLCSNMTHLLNVPCTFKQIMHDYDPGFPTIHPGYMKPIPPMSEWNCLNFFKYDYYASQSKVTFYLIPRHNFIWKIYLFYDKERKILLLAENEYFFEIETDEEVKKGVIKGSFRLKVGEDEYLSVGDTDSNTKSCQIKVTGFDKKHPEKFDFHFLSWEHAYDDNKFMQFQMATANTFGWIPNTGIHLKVGYAETYIHFMRALNLDENNEKELDRKYSDYTGEYQFKFSYHMLEIMRNCGYTNFLREGWSKAYIGTEDLSEKSPEHIKLLGQLREMRVLLLAITCMNYDAGLEFIEMNKLPSADFIDYEGNEKQTWYKAAPLLQRSFMRFSQIQALPDTMIYVYFGKSLQPLIERMLADDGDYNCALLTSLMINDFRDTKRMHNINMVNVKLCEIIYNCLSKKEDYFKPINLEQLAQEYESSKIKFIDKLKNEIPDEIDRKAGYLNDKEKTIISYKDIYEGEREQEVRRNCENDTLLTLPNNMTIKLGTLFMDAAMCSSRCSHIIDKMRMKYPFQDLIDTFQYYNTERMHFYEAIIKLVRCLYVENNPATGSSKNLSYSYVSVSEFVSSIMNVILKTNDYRTLNALRLVYEVITLIYWSLINRIEMKQTLRVLREFNIVDYILRLLKKMSITKILTKPYGIEFRYKQRGDYSSLNWKHNQFMLDKKSTGHDIVIETYEKDVVIISLELISLIYNPAYNSLFTKHAKIGKIESDIDNITESLYFTQDQHYCLLDTLTKLIAKFADPEYEKYLTNLMVTMILNSNWDNEHTKKVHIRPQSHACKEAIELNGQILKALAQIHEQDPENQGDVKELIKVLESLDNMVANNVFDDDERVDLVLQDDQLHPLHRKNITYILMELLVSVNDLMNDPNFAEECVRLTNRLVGTAYNLLLSILKFDKLTAFDLWKYSKTFYRLKWANKYINHLHAEFALNVIMSLGIEICLYNSMCEVESIIKVILPCLEDKIKQKLITEELSDEEARKNGGNKYVFVNQHKIINVILSYMIKYKISAKSVSLLLKPYEPEEKENEESKGEEKEEPNDEEKEKPADEEKEKSLDKAESTINNIINGETEENPDSSINLHDINLNDHAKLKYVDSSKMSSQKFFEVKRTSKRKTIEQWTTESVDYLIRSFKNKVVEEGSRDDLMVFLKFVYLMAQCLEKDKTSIRNFQNKLIIMTFFHRLIKNRSLSSLDDVQNIFYSEEFTQYMFNIVIDQPDYSQYDTEMKGFAFRILTSLVGLNSTRAKEAFRKWSSYQYPTYKLFTRLSQLYGNLCAATLRPSIAEKIDGNIKLTDVMEVKKSIKYFRVLCNNDEEFQRYLIDQNNCPVSINLLPAISYLLKASIFMIKYKFGQNIVLTALRTITALINGQNEEVIEFFVNDKIMDPITEIIKLGYFKDGKYVISEFRNTKMRVTEEKQADEAFNFDGNVEESDGEEDIPHENNDKIASMKMFACKILLYLIHEDNADELSRQITPSVLHNLVMLSYARVTNYSNGRYIDEYFEDKSYVSRNFDIRTAFLSYYIINELYEKDNNDEFNVIQDSDHGSRFKKYITLIKNWCHKIAFWRDKTPVLTQKQYTRIIGRQSKSEYLEKAIEYFDAHSSHIEIFMPGRGIVTKYFEIKPAYLAFTQDDKDKFWETANLSDCKTFCSSLFEYSIEKTHELEIQNKVQNYYFSMQSVAQRSNWLTDILKFLIVVQNIFIFLGYARKNDQVEDPSIIGSPTRTLIIMNVIGVLICVGLCYFTLVQGLISCNKVWYILKDELQDSDIEMYQKVKLVLFYPFEVLKRRDIWCLIPCIIFAVFSMISNFYYFVGCLIMIIIYSPQIMQVVNAVWEPRNRILITLLLTVMVIYVYAVISFVSFDKDFDATIQDSCNNVYNCMTVILDQWYKNGLGGFLSENIQAIANSSGEYSLDWSRFIYDMVFFILVPTLLINILAGIIIDNFGERRALSDSIKDSQHSQCYICGKAHSDIADFHSHTSFLHNGWDYMYYIGYIKSMPASELTDYVDVFIKKMIEQESLKWFPCYEEEILEKEGSSDEAADTDITKDLKKMLENDKRIDNVQEEIDNMKSKVGNIESKVDMIENKVGNIENKVDLIESKVNENTEKFNSINDVLSEIKESIKGLQK